MSYAARTTVPVEQSQNEIRRLLSKHGCQSFAFADLPERAAIQFILDGLPYRFTVERPTVEQMRAKKRVAGRLGWTARLDQEWKRRWRARLLWLKATLEFAEAEGDRSVIQKALMSNLVLPTGQTMDAWAAKALPEAYAAGGMPPLLPGGGE